MVFHYSYGQLGNQLFHYAFLRTVTRPGQRIITSNFSELRKFCDLPDRIVFIRHAVFKYSVPFLKLAARLRLFSWYRPVRVNRAGVDFEINEVVFRRGILPVTVIFPGYFQSESLFDPGAVADLRIRETHLREASRILSAIGDPVHKVFVHVRRGDYLTIDFHGLRDTAVPISYFSERIGWFRQNVKDPFFVFVTDDPAYVEAAFSDVEPKYVSHASKYTDLALMSLCSSGIMSNSSFSWWGGFLMKQRHHLFAPKNWLGFRKGIEIPGGIFPGFATPVDVTTADVRHGI